MKVSFLTTLLLLLCGTLMADNASKKEAQQRAEELFGSNTPMQLVAVAEGDHPAYYVFNAQRDQKGFVIVAAEDQHDILGYADSGEFDPTNLPSAMQYWLQCYEEQIAEVRAGRAAPHRAVVREAIAPLIKTLWGQGKPYSNQLPTNPTTNSGYEHTGCVATAMAQVLRYWASPVTTTAIDSYTYSYTSGGTQVEVSVDGLEPTAFAYELMRDEYSVDADDASADEVAKLMRYCGQAAHMRYYEEESSASTQGSYFAAVFGFNPNYEENARQAYTSAEWDELVYGELAAGRPVIVSGAKFNNAGHAFICDGYKDGLFHLNWGWSGYCNGYFKLSEANPYGQGTGAGSGLDGFSFRQRVLTRIQPEPTEPRSSAALMTVESLKTDNTTYTRSAVSSDFTIPVVFSVWNKTTETQLMYTGVGIYQNEKLVQSYRFSYNELTSGLGFRDRKFEIKFGSGLSSGTYVLKAVSHTPDKDWEPDLNSSQYFVVLTINGNTLTAEPSRNALLVNSVATEGVQKVGSTVTVKANITNTGNLNVSSVYLFVNGALATGAGVNFGGGETDDVLLHFQPAAVGQLPMVLTLDKEGTQQLWAGSIDITQRTDPNLYVGSPVVANSGKEGDVSFIKGTTFSFSVPITNRAAESFDDEIVAYLYKNTNGGTRFGYERSERTIVSIGAGEQKKLEMSFDGLEIGARYLAVLYAYNASSELQQVSKQIGSFTIQADPSGIQLVTVDSALDSKVSVYDLRGRRMGTVGDVLSKGVYVVKGRKLVVR